MPRSVLTLFEGLKPHLGFSPSRHSANGDAQAVAVMHRASYDAPMPAVNPRITITLQPSVHALLRRMSELTGNSQSSLVAELLEQSSNVFERMVRILEAAEKLKEQGRAMGDEFKQGLEHAQSNMESQLGLVLERLDQGEGALLEMAEAIDRRRAPAVGGAPRRTRTGSAAPSAPISNRGVTPHPKGQKQGKVSVNPSLRKARKS